MAIFTSSDQLRGAEFVGADLQDSWFRESNLRRVRIRGADLTGADIDGDVDGVRVNGIEIAPLGEAELDRRYPERAALRARDAASLRAGWAGLEAIWAPTMERAAARPPGTVDVSVDDEWSFAQTLRHLVFATDVWLGAPILGRPDAFHPIGVPFSGLRQGSKCRHRRGRRPRMRRCCRRAERVALVATATVSDETLGEQRGQLGLHRRRTVPGLTVPVDHRQGGVAPPPLRGTRPGRDRRLRARVTSSLAR
jgi:hypothetical protein